MPSTSGAIAAGITHVTGAVPMVMGKPSGLVMEVIGSVLGMPAAEVVVVGDDARLEMRMAREAGAYGVLVLTGSTRQAQPGDADLVVDSMANLLAHLK